MSSDKERKTKISPKAQRIIDISVTSLEALIVVACIIVSVMVFVGVTDASKRSINWFAVQTDSMMGTEADNFNPGDLVFTKKPANESEITVGCIIAFKATIKDSAGKTSEQVLIHRVVKVLSPVLFETKGDNTRDDDVDTFKPTFNDILGVYHGKKINGIGKVVLWLGGYKKVATNTGKNVDASLLGGYGYQQTGTTTTFLVIVIPLALLFVYNAYVVIKWILDERAKKIRAAALAEAQAGTATAEDQEAIKRAALVEFMKAQGMTQEQMDAYFASLAPTDNAAVTPSAVEESPKEASESVADETVIPSAVEESPKEETDSSTTEE